MKKYQPALPGFSLPLLVRTIDAMDAASTNTLPKLSRRIESHLRKNEPSKKIEKRIN